MKYGIGALTILLIMAFAMIASPVVTVKFLSEVIE